MKTSLLRFACLVAFLFSLSARAAEEAWEALPDGTQGRIANFAGADGAKIAGYVRKPAGPGPFPLIVVLHGGAPTAKPVADDAAAAEAARAAKVLGHSSHPPLPELLAQGWAVYTIDYRTHPRYTLDPLEWDDTMTAIRLAREFSFVDQKRVAIYGGSHGGHVSGRMITRLPFCCAVLCAPAGLDMIALARLAEKGTAIGANQRLVREMEQRSSMKMEEVARNPAAQHYSSLLTEAADVRCPVLLISGRNDPNAPIALMDEYVAKLKSLGKEVETYHPDNGPHGFYVGLPKVIPETAESTRATVAFLKKHFAAVQP